jgi:hypothetical protein
MEGRFVRALIAAVISVAWLSMPNAKALVDTVVITHVGGEDSNTTDYIPGTDALGVPAVLIAGGELQYRNMNTGLPHDLISTTCVNVTQSYEATNTGGACQAGGSRLFQSGVIGFNQTSPVEGTSSLLPGRYGFYCSVHGPAMAGSLEVVGA